MVGVREKTKVTDVIHQVKEPWVSVQSRAHQARTIVVKIVPLDPHLGPYKLSLLIILNENILPRVCLLDPLPPAVVNLNLFCIHKSFHPAFSHPL